MALVGAGLVAVVEAVQEEIGPDYACFRPAQAAVDHRLGGLLHVVTSEVWAGCSRRGPHTSGVGGAQGGRRVWLSEGLSSRGRCRRATTAGCGRLGVVGPGPRRRRRPR